MAQVDHFDIVVLGSGQGGKHLAWHFGKAGKRVAVVEKRWIGGSCPAVACMPSKNEIWSAKVAHTVRTAGEFGTVVSSSTTNMLTVRGRKREMIERQTATHLAAYEESDVELIMGRGCFSSQNEIEVALNGGGTRIVSGASVVINVGTHAAMPNVPGLAAATPLTHIEALELDHLPSHLIVLGGGYVGIEMAQAFRRLGSEVTILEPGTQILGREDGDVADEVSSIITREGIRIITGAKATNVTGASGWILNVTIEADGKTQVLEGSDLLVAAGRIPNTAGIGLSSTGVEVDSRGFIRVNERLETSAPAVWAVGECAGSPQFTHVSVDDFKIVRDNMEGGDRRTDDRILPYVMFTEPPLARVGLSEGEAVRQGIAIRSATLPMAKVLRTDATGEKQGWMKAIVSEANDQVLGFTMIGDGAGEVLAAVQTAMIAGLSFKRLRDAVLAHLTYAEGLGPLLAQIVERSPQV